MTLTLAAFLEARLAEDEAEARRGDGQDFVPTGYWDNARVLAEVAAVRAILAAALADSNRSRYGGCDDDCEWKALDYALRHLAAVYADHADYDPSWAVS